MTKLVDVKPDFEAILAQLQAALANKEAWIDLVESSTGQTIAEMIAGIGTMLNFNVERSVPELFTDTAFVDTSIYAIARMLGVNPARKISATTEVTILIAGGGFASSVTIPERTQFEINGISFYNPSDITFPAFVDTLTNVILEQGLLQTTSFTGDGSDFQEYVISIDFLANENFMFVSVDAVEHTRERRSLWQFSPGDKVFLELTFPDGSVKIVFPNALFGTPPPLSSAIIIQHADSLGSQANDANTGLSLVMIDTVNTIFGDLEVSGSNTLGISGGQEQVSTDVLRFTAPRLFASAERAVRRQDYQTIPLGFTNREIVDVNIEAEFEKFVGDNTRMNIIDLTLLPLTGASLTAGEKTAFQIFMEEFKHVTTQLVIIDPVPVVVSITANIFYFDGQDANAIESSVDAALTDLFARQLNSLGKTFALTDITDTILSAAGEGTVDYVDLTLPTVNIILGADEFADLTMVTLNLAVSTRL